MDKFNGLIHNDYINIQEPRNNYKINILLFIVIFLLLIQIFIISICIYVYISESNNINTVSSIIRTIDNKNIGNTISNIIKDVNAILNTFGSVNNIKSFIVKITTIVDKLCNIISCSDDVNYNISSLTSIIY